MEQSFTRPVIRPVRQVPEAPRNIYELSDKQRRITMFTRGDERGLNDSMVVPDEDIPQVRKSQAPKNNFTRKMEDHFAQERADDEQQEGADSHDDAPKVEQRPVRQPQPDSDSGSTHHGSKGHARSVLTTVMHNPRKLGRIINYDDGIEALTKD